MITTRITKFFGIERPIVQGGLMWIARSELASAVANAGGIGFMTALTFEDPEDLRKEIGKEMLEEGDVEKGILAAGQTMGFVRDIPSCRALLDRIMAEAEQIIRDKFTQVIVP